LHGLVSGKDELGKAHSKVIERTRKKNKEQSKTCAAIVSIRFGHKRHHR